MKNANHLLWAGSVLTTLLMTTTASAQERPFSMRYGTTASGDIRLIGNASMTCDAAQTLDCADARQGTAVTSQNNNNAHVMTHIDIDADSSTFGSSAATLSLPQGAQVLWAGLYWGGNVGAGTDGVVAPAAANKNTVKLKLPGANAYQSITATTCDNRGDDYQCVSDISAIISASMASGDYTVANIQSGTGKGQYGGWSIIAVFEDASEPVRNLVVFDGYIYISSTNNNVDVPVSGFLTPPMGPVQSRIGVIGYEGDFNATGDSMRLAGQSLSDVLNPTSNVFNSSNTALGQRVTATQPSYPNQLGFDVDLIEATGLIANSATSTTITLRTGGETYYPGAVTIATEIYAPRIEAIKRVLDVNGQDLEPGDEVEYSFEVTNEGFDPAQQVILADTLAPQLSYVPGSIRVNGQTLTDAQDTDQGRYDSASRQVIVNIGQGASAAQGGAIARGDAAITVSFRAKLANTLASGDQVINQGLVTYRSQTLGRDFASLSDADAQLTGRVPTVITVDQAAPSITIQSPAAGAVTKQRQPVISGTTEPNATVTISINGAQQGSVTADAAGRYSLTPPAPLNEGAQIVTATATDRAGNSAQAMSDFAVDTTAPMVRINTPAQGSTLKEQRPVISGTTEPGATVSLSIDNGQPTTLTADAMGNFSYTPARALGDGAHSVTATASDAAGNSAADTTSFTIDTKAPALSIDSPKGGEHIAQAQPTIEGSADAGASVTITIDNGQPATITADAQGKWSYPVPQQLAEGEHTIQAQAEDNSGNKANTSSTFTVDTTAPSVTITTPTQDERVSVRRPTLSGTADPGATVELTVDGQVVTTITANAQGQWVHSLMMDLEDGQHSVQATATDMAGNSAQAERDFVVSISAPGMVVITSPLDGATLNAQSDRTIRGRATPNTTVSVFVDGELIGTAMTNANGQWSLLPTQPLSEGQHTISAEVPGDQAQITITLDTQGPALAILSPEDNSSPAQDPPEITGTSDPNTQVTIFINGQRAGNTTADAQGQWSFTPAEALGQGQHLISARAQDLEGNTTIVEIGISYTSTGYIAVGGPSGACTSLRPATGAKLPTGGLLWLLGGLSVLALRRRRNRNNR